MPGAFYYQGPEAVADLQSSGTKCGEVDVGSVTEDKLEVLATIWAISVLLLLKKEGLVDDFITEDYVRGMLKEK
jgi:hypothetical protein